MARSAREIRPWQTAYERFARWETDGTSAKLLEHVQVRDDAVGRVDWTVSVDSTINRVTSTPLEPVKKGPWQGQTGNSATLGGGAGPRPVPGRADHLRSIWPSMVAACPCPLL